MKTDWQKQVVEDKRAIIELPVLHSWLRRYAIGSVEYWDELEKELTREANDLIDFIRDHRSRDHYNISIETISVVVCKFCGYRWGAVEDGYVIAPDCCEAAMRVYGNWED